MQQGKLAGQGMPAEDTLVGVEHTHWDRRMVAAGLEGKLPQHLGDMRSPGLGTRCSRAVHIHSGPSQRFGVHQVEGQDNPIEGSQSGGHRL
jgi:hypothetical protein